MIPPISILLPGLDGTGDLFEPFIAAAPAGFPTQCVRLPSNRPLGYDGLVEWVRAQLPAAPVVLIAESFSGPLALLVADQCSSVVGIVLSATFVEPPLPRLFARIPKFVWNRPPPALLLSKFLTGGDRALAGAIRRAMASVTGDVVAARIAAALRVDVTVELGRYCRPLLCLRGKQDRVLPRASFARIQALKPSAKFIDLEGPHLLLQANPIEAWTHIKRFVEKAADSDTS